MRGFFLLLLLTNVAAFAWQFYKTGDDSRSIDVYRDIPIVNNGLTLISELPEGQRPELLEPETSDVAKESALPVESESEGSALDSAGPGDGESSKENMAYCYRVRGISDKASAKAFVKWLQTQGASSLKQEQQEVKRVIFWVMLPAYTDRKKANEAAEILAKKRVRDFFIVRSGEHENAISLGVFSSRERAERRYNEIVNLKARLRKPRISEVERPVQNYQVSFELADGTARKALSSYIKREQLRPEEQISCK